MERGGRPLLFAPDHTSGLQQSEIARPGCRQSALRRAGPVMEVMNSQSWPNGDHDDARAPARVLKGQRDLHHTQSGGGGPAGASLGYRVLRSLARLLALDEPEQTR